MTAFAVVFGGLAANAGAYFGVSFTFHTKRKRLREEEAAVKRRCADAFDASPEEWARRLRHEQALERKGEEELDALREQVDALRFQLELASRKGGQTYRPRREEANRAARDDDGPGAGSSASMDEDDGPGAGR